MTPSHVNNLCLWHHPMLLTPVCLRTLPGLGCCLSPADDADWSRHHALHHRRRLHLQSVWRQRLLQLMFRYRQPRVKGNGILCHFSLILAPLAPEARRCLMLSCIVVWQKNSNPVSQSVCNHHYAFQNHLSIRQTVSVTLWQISSASFWSYTTIHSNQIITWTASDTHTFLILHIKQNYLAKIICLYWPICLEQSASVNPSLWFFFLTQNCS